MSSTTTATIEHSFTQCLNKTRYYPVSQLERLVKSARPFQSRWEGSLSVEPLVEEGPGRETCESGRVCPKRGDPPHWGGGAAQSCLRANYPLPFGLVEARQQGFGHPGRPSSTRLETQTVSHTFLPLVGLERSWPILPQQQKVLKAQVSGPRWCASTCATPEHVALHQSQLGRLPLLSVLSIPPLCRSPPQTAFLFLTVAAFRRFSLSTSASEPR